MKCCFEGQPWVFSFLSQGVLHLAVQCEIGAAKSQRRRLTRGDQNTFCKSDPNVDGAADVRIDRWILQEWSHAACSLTPFQWDQVVRPGCSHALVTHCCSGRSICHMSRAVAWQSRHESVCAQPASFKVSRTGLRSHFCSGWARICRDFLFLFFNRMKLTKFALQIIPCWNCGFKGTALLTAGNGFGN